MLPSLLYKFVLSKLQEKHGSSMQKYIESKRPKTHSDVERLETQYQRTIGNKQWP